MKETIKVCGKFFYMVLSIMRSPSMLVRNITGICELELLALNISIASNPKISGISISSNIKSGIIFFKSCKHLSGSR